MSTSISSKTHPSLSPAERRAERARTEGAGYKILHSQITLRRKSDGKVGRIRFALVSRPGQETPYTVRLRANGDPCRCSCPDYTRRSERDGAAVEPCKHFGIVLLARGQDQYPPEVPAAWQEVSPRAEEPAPLEDWAAKVLRERAELWPAD